MHQKRWGRKQKIPAFNIKNRTATPLAELFSQHDPLFGGAFGIVLRQIQKQPGDPPVTGILGKNPLHLLGNLVDIAVSLFDQGGQI